LAQIKLLKIDTDGVNKEMNTASDEITLASYTVTGGGPVLNANLDMNNGNVTDAGLLSFTDPATDGITQTAGLLVADNIMGKDRQNTMTTAGSVTFADGIADSAGEVDAFKLPTIAGVPTATPSVGAEGHLVWDSTGDAIYAWDGAAWKDLSISDEAGAVCNYYTADEALAAFDAVYISAADNVSKADVSGAGAASRVIGITEAAAIDTASVKVCSDGVVTGLSGLTAGARYYANPAVAGGMTTTLPVGSGNTIVQLGYAKSATAIHLHIEQLGRRA
jgi:hypothetical protein